MLSQNGFLTFLAQSVFLLTCVPGATLVFVRIWILVRLMRGLSPLGEGEWPGMLLLLTLITARLSACIAVVLFVLWRKSFVSAGFGRFARVVFWVAVAGVLVTYAPRFGF